MKMFILLSGLVLMTTMVKSQSAPASADDVLKEARMQAAKENKNVFVMFHASWCGWCRKMDSSMNDKAVKKFFDNNYIIRHLTVYESKGKENLENPGALELLKKYKGNDQGIPYWFVFDKDGKMLEDSKLRPQGGKPEQGENMGCPASEKEVAEFINVLKRTSSLTDAELKLIFDRFRQNEAK